MRTGSILAVLLALTCLACRAPEGPPPPAPLAGATLFYDGLIYLGAPDWKPVEAVLVSRGRIVATGDVGRLENMVQRKTLNRVKLGGGVALPGLQDAHGHLEGLGKALESVDLRGCTSYEELIERVAAQAAQQPAGTWIEGRGWDQNLWEGGAFPHHGALSERVSGHPVFLKRVDGHAALANAAALHIAGLGGPEQDEYPIAGGRVLLGADGRATGVLIDRAQGLLAGHVPAPDDEVRTRRLLRAQDELLSLGLTAVHDMGVEISTVLLLERLRTEGRLKLRMIEYLAGNSGLTRELLEDFPLPAGRGDVLAVTGVKLVVDGALGSRGAALLEDYSDDPGNRGLTLLDERQLAERIALCAAAGMQPALHAIGDRANRMALDALEAQMLRTPSFRDLRPRIEHAQIVAPVDWRRFAELGIVPSMQPTHCTSDMPWAPERVGSARIAGAYAWRNLAPDTSVLAFGSDFPVELPDPLAGVYAAVTRRTQDGAPGPDGFRPPGQALDMRTALAGFTAGAARAVHQEDRRGRLQPGFACDMTVLDLDPLEAEDPTSLLRAEVVMTVINGEVVYDAR